MSVVLLLSLLTLSLFFGGIAQFWAHQREASRITDALRPDVGEDAAVLRRTTAADRLATAGPWGDALERLRSRSNLDLSPGSFLMASLGICMVLAMTLGAALSWYLSPVGFAAGIFAIRAFANRQANQRRENFINQMPELARTLANASSAGLSPRTALALAADELQEPARSELREVSAQINLGRTLDQSLSSLEDRLQSREVSILVSSVIVSARTGGALVTALRDIAETLEERKELRRGVRSTYAQTVATAYAVLGMGVLSLFLLERLHNGTVNAMLANGVGRIVLIVAVAVYVGGILAVRRMTRVEV